MARLVIGGKYNNQIVFQGNKKYLPASLRAIITAYFNNWNSLKDIATFPGLLNELGQAGGERHFQGTDWEKLNELYHAHMERYTLVFHGAADPKGGVRFQVKAQKDQPARPLKSILAQYADGDGVIEDNFDIWCVEKLLRRANAQIKYDGSFGAALKRFGAAAVSFEESISFFKQIQAYHAPKFLVPELRDVLLPVIDEVHTVKEPTGLGELVDKLRELGAKLRVHPSVEPVTKHYYKLAQAGAPATDGRPPGNDDPRVPAVLGDDIKARLYPFQREGVAFLTVNRRALLADDMGLGKTLQAIAGALYLKRREGLKRVLIVCPASLKYQWQSEIQRFTSEKCEVIGGDKSEREAIYRAASVDGGFIAPEDRPFFYAINYELVYRDIEQLKQLGAELLILDEAQRVKNFRTKTAKAVFELPAPCLFVLTGTPLENQLMELYTIMRFIDERALGKNPVAFRDRYVITDRFGGITGYRLVEEVARKIAALTLRRTKDQTLDELPDLVEKEVWLELTEIQRQIYKELRGQAREVLSEAAWDSAKANNAMTLVQRLREVCDTPELIDPEQKESQKLNEFMSLVDDEVRSLDRQLIVFTQWTRVGNILVRELKAGGYSVGFLHGGVKAQDRQELVRRFMEGEDRVFVSTDAGGTGLNLQKASLVVNFDLPFNPAKLNQRIGRAHRIGQKNTVVVVNLLCLNTVEHRLVKILKEKQELFDDVFGDISDPELARPGRGQQRSLRELLRELVE